MVNKMKLDGVGETDIWASRGDCSCELCISVAERLAIGCNTMRVKLRLIVELRLNFFPVVLVDPIVPQSRDVVLWRSVNEVGLIKIKCIPRQGGL